MGLMGQPSAMSFLVAGVLWLLIGVLPGLLVVSVLDPGRSLLDRLAIAPLVSIGLGFAAAAWAGMLGVPHSLWLAPTMLVVASVAAAVALVRRVADRSWRTRWTAARRRTWLAIGGSILVSTVLWMLAFTFSAPGWSAVMPSFDGVTHGIMVTDMLRSGSMFPPLLGRPDLATAGAAGPTGPFGVPVVIYPLGVHVLAAPIGALTTVSSALLVPLTVMSSSWLILGIVALTRRIASPRHALGAGAAAAFLAPMFPFWNVYWGGAPMMLAIALVPAASIALLTVGRGRGLITPSIALAGLFAIHVTEVLVVVLLVGLQQIFSWHGVATLRAMGRMLGSLVAALLLAAPLTLYLAFTQGAERPQDDSPHMDAATAAYVAVLRPYVVLTTASGALLAAVLASGVLLVLLSILGARVIWGQPLGRSVVVLTAGMSSLAALAYVTHAGLLTSPWYSNGDRLVAQAAALLPCLLGVALVDGRDRIGSAPRAVRALTVTVGSGVVAVMLVQASQTATDAISRYSVVTDSDRQAFAWLAAHAKPGERVLNDDSDGSVWMYEASRGTVSPLFGGRPGGGFQIYPEYAGRLHLLDTIQDIGRDPQTRAEASEWNVRYVFVGERTIKNGPRFIDAAGLERSDGVRLVFDGGGARVYEIVAR